MNTYVIHLSLDFEETNGFGGTTVTAPSLDAAVSQAKDAFGDDVVLVEGPDGSRELL